MKLPGLVAILLAVPFLALWETARAQVPGQLLNLSCMEALVSVNRRELAGIFYFVPEKDAPQAFADFLMHDKKALKLFMGKMDKDRKVASGVSAWDHEALQFALMIYASPLKSTLTDPGDKMIAHMRELSSVQVVPLEAIEAARRKG